MFDNILYLISNDNTFTVGGLQNWRIGDELFDRAAKFSSWEITGPMATCVGDPAQVTCFEFDQICWCAFGQSALVEIGWSMHKTMTLSIAMQAFASGEASWYKH